MKNELTKPNKNTDSDDEITQQLLAEFDDPDQIKIILLHAVQGMSLREIGDTMNISHNTARMKLLNPASQEAIRMLNRHMMLLEAGEARSVLRGLMHSARSEKVRLDAANSLLDRAGLGAAVGEKVQITGNNVQVNIEI